MVPRSPVVHNNAQDSIHSTPSLLSTPAIMAPSTMFKNRSFKLSPFSAGPNDRNSRYPWNVSKEIRARKTPLIAVIGVGFVGAGLIDSFSSRYNVLGFDVDKDRIHDLRKEFRSRPNVTLTSTESDLGKATHFLISVPTLLRPDKSINLSYLENALQKVEQYAKRGSTVVIESSVAVGHTRELLGPIAMARGLFAGMSPEVSKFYCKTMPLCAYLSTAYRSWPD